MHPAPPPCFCLPPSGRPVSLQQKQMQEQGQEEEQVHEEGQGQEKVQEEGPTNTGNMTRIIWCARLRRNEPRTAGSS